MEITFEAPDCRGDVALTAYDPLTTLADVVEQVSGAAAPAVVFVDGGGVPSSTSISAAALHTGSVLSLSPPTGLSGFDDDTDGDATVELVQLAGPGAGRRRRLGAGRYSIGEGRRLDAVDLELAGVGNAAFELHIDDHGEGQVSDASNGVVLDGVAVTSRAAWSGGILVAGGRAFALRRPPGSRSPRAIVDTARGVVPFNRPPRHVPESGVTSLDVPDGGRTVGERRQFPVLALLAPIPLAVAMAVIMQRPQMLLFGLLSPVMMLANWVEDRRSRGRELATSTRADAAAEAEFGALVREAHAADLARSRAAHPDIAELVERALTWAPTLWERRPGDTDAWRIPIALADRDWTPELQRNHGAIAAAADIVANAGPLTAVPVVADLGFERGLAIVGQRHPAMMLARGIVLSAATIHGPADLSIVICTNEVRARQWEWAKWLPHNRNGTAPQILTEHDQMALWAANVRRRAEQPDPRAQPSHLTMAVVDVASWWHDRDAPLRGLLAAPSLPVRFVAIADRRSLVPSACSTVVSVPTSRPGIDHQATVTVDNVVEQRQHRAIPFSVDAALALQTARALAPVEDADVRLSAEAVLPDRQGILDLLEISDPAPNTIADRWVRSPRPARPRARIGITEHGPLEVDLVHDGPHGLIAGTTGAGKSELLRSLVVSFAASLPPDDLNFVLVDFKGGSAFDACADLPHTVGMVTDLDEHLAGRVLRCLRAELQHRELVLREAGATSLDEYQSVGGTDPLPRLVLVVDEFASVASELPEFMPSLVDVAQRGRSLGIHLILATQRPAGVVDAKIKANTNLRIALRVQDEGDSLDVIGLGNAAALPRHLPGRAFARFGAGEVVQFQSAYATGASDDYDDETALAVAPWVVSHVPPAIEAAAAGATRVPAGSSNPRDGTPSDLERLVGAIARAAGDVGQLTQRRPCLEPLPTMIPISAVLAAEAGEAAVPLGVIDLPDEQRRAVRWWTPGPDGSLVVYGVSGAGTSSLLASLALGASHRYSPDELHLYAIDADTNLLDPIDGLPHCGAVVPVDDLPRVGRLCRMLVDELARRKRLVTELGHPSRVLEAEPAIALFVDNVGAVRQALEGDRELTAVWSELEQIIRDGQSVGICTVVTAKHERAMPATTSTQFPQRLVMRVGEATAYTSFGFRSADLPAFVPGRALDPGDHTELQVACPPADLAAAVSEAARRWSGAPVRPARRVDVLPAAVPLSTIVGAAHADDTGLDVPIGLDTATAAVATIRLDDGSSAFVVGPARSGRSSVLAVLAGASMAASLCTPVYAICPRGGPLSVVPGLAGVATRPAEVAPMLAEVLAAGHRRIVLVDDADRLAGPSFDALAAADDDRLIVVLAGRPDEFRSLGHWTKPRQHTRSGVLLRPAPTDGDLLRVPLPLRLPSFTAGQGLLVDDGKVARILAATPEGGG